MTYVPASAAVPQRAVLIHWHGRMECAIWYINQQITTQDIENACRLSERTNLSIALKGRYQYMVAQGVLIYLEASALPSHG